MPPRVPYGGPRLSGSDAPGYRPGMGMRMNPVYEPQQGPNPMMRGKAGQPQQLQQQEQQPAGDGSRTSVEVVAQEESSQVTVVLVIVSLLAYASMTAALQLFLPEDEGALAAHNREVPVLVYQMSATAFFTSFVLNLTSFLFEDSATKRQLALLSCTIKGTACYTDLLMVTLRPLVVYDQHGTIMVPHRYAQWAITTPLMVYILSKISDFTPRRTALAASADIAMVASGFITHLCPAPFHWAFFCFSSVLFVYVVWEMGLMVMSAIKANSGSVGSTSANAQRSLVFIYVCTLIIWHMFPLAWVISYFQPHHALRNEVLVLFANFTAKVLFSSSIMYGNYMTIAQRRLLAKAAEESQRRIAMVSELKEAVTRKDQFMSLMSHELRTPLNGIIQLSDALCRGAGGELNPKGSHFMTTIKNSSNHLLNIINDILDVAALKEGKLAIKHEVVHLSKAVGHVIDIVSPLAKKEVRIEQRVDPNTPLVVADFSRMVQVLYNLMGNALKFTKSGSVRVTVAPKDSTGAQVVIKVQDTGIGIPKAKIPTIWGAFEQVDMSVTRKYGGTGLGLNIVQQLVSSHEGVISCDSTEGVGTTFTITLPVLQRNSRPSLEEQVRSSALSLGYNWDTLVRAIPTCRSNSTGMLGPPSCRNSGTSGVYQISGGGNGSLTSPGPGARASIERFVSSGQPDSSLDGPPALSALSATRSPSAFGAALSSSNNVQPPDERLIRQRTYELEREAVMSDLARRTETKRSMEQERAYEWDSHAKQAAPQHLQASMGAGGGAISMGEALMAMVQRSGTSPEAMAGFPASVAVAGGGAHGAPAPSTPMSPAPHGAMGVWSGSPSQQFAGGGDGVRGSKGVHPRLTNLMGKEAQQARSRTEPGDISMGGAGTDEEVYEETSYSGSPQHGFNRSVRHVAGSNPGSNCGGGARPFSANGHPTVRSRKSLRQLAAGRSQGHMQDSEGDSPYAEGGGGLRRSESFSGSTMGKGMRRGVSSPGCAAPHGLSLDKLAYSSMYGSVQILSVDDEEVNQIVLEEILGSAGYLYARAMDGLEALEWLEGQATLPDLILLDCMMPNMSGHQFCATLRQYIPSSVLPVIMVSAKSDNDNIVEGLRSGSNDFIRKPYQREELLARIETQIRLKNDSWWLAELMNNQDGRETESMKLLKNILPEGIIARMQSGQKFVADSHPNVVILFSDIVGFTDLSSKLPTAEVFLMLSNMFNAFDKLTDRYSVYKVETIGDAYMVAAGHDEDEAKAGKGAPLERVIGMARAMLDVVQHTTAPNGEKLKIRIGIHCGPAFAGVIGSKCPRYCFLGDTVNTASRMESLSYPMCIQLSASVVAARGPGYEPEAVRLGERQVKGKGIMTTYLLKYGEWQLGQQEYERQQLLHQSNSTASSVLPVLGPSHAHTPPAGREVPGGGATSALLATQGLLEGTPLEEEAAGSRPPAAGAAGAVPAPPPPATHPDLHTAAEALGLRQQLSAAAQRAEELQAQVCGLQSQVVASGQEVVVVRQEAQAARMEADMERQRAALALDKVRAIMSQLSTQRRALAASAPASGALPSSAGPTMGHSSLPAARPLALETAGQGAAAAQPRTLASMFMLKPAYQRFVTASSGGLSAGGSLQDLSMGGLGSLPLMSMCAPLAGRSITLSTMPQALALSALGPQAFLGLPSSGDLPGASHSSSLGGAAARHRLADISRVRFGASGLAEWEVAANGVLLVPPISLVGVFSELGFGAYVPRFQQEHVRLDQLLALDVAALQALGVGPLGHCLRLREVVADIAAALLRACEERAAAVVVEEAAAAEAAAGAAAATATAAAAEASFAETMATVAAT